MVVRIYFRYAAFLIVFIICCLEGVRAQQHDLSYFILMARKENPVIQDYLFQMQKGQLDSAIFVAGLRPRLDIISTNSHAPVIAGYGYDEAITNITTLSELLQVSRNFISPGNKAAQLRAIRLQNQTLADSMQLSERDLIRTITTQYITAYGTQLSMESNKEMYILLQQEEKVLRQLAERSVLKQTDYLNFYITMQQQELAYLQSQIQFENEFLTLNYLSGIADTAIGTLSNPAIDTMETTDFFHAVFYNHFITDSLRIENERQLLHYSYQPKIGTYADAGYVSSLLYKAYKNWGFSFGISLNIPLNDGGQKKLKMARLDIEEKNRLQKIAFYQKQYQQQTMMFRRQLATTDLLVNKINEQIKYSNTLVKANTLLLEKGEITVRDYVLALNNYVIARQQLNQQFVRKLQIITDIKYWNP